MHCMCSESLEKGIHVALHLGSFLLPDLNEDLLFIREPKILMRLNVLIF